MMGPMMPNMSSPNLPIGAYSSAPMNVHAGLNHKPIATSSGVPKGPMINSPVMSPISGHGGMIPRSMSPQSIGVSERQLVGPPSMSPQTAPGGAERNPIFQPNQYRLSSPQYSPAHPGPNPPFSQSPSYSQGYNPSSLYKPPTPQSYPKPPTPQTYPKPPTPSSYPKPPTPQNPTTPGSYPNPPTPGSYPAPTTPISHHNPATPISCQNPLTPQPSYDPPTPQNSQHNTSFENSSIPTSAAQTAPASSSSTTPPVIQQNLHAMAAVAGGGANSFALPKSESVIQSPVHNVFKDSSKIMTPMLSPPSTTSSLRKI